MTDISLLPKATAARRLLAGVMVVLTCLLLAIPVRAQPVDDLMEALKLEEMLEIMQTEGVAYGEELAEDMLPGGNSPRWQDLLTEIYDTEKMRAVVRQGFADAMETDDPEPLIAFFSSELGSRIIDLELSARRAMIDDRIEEAARETFRTRQAEDDPRLDQITRFIEANDLLEANVTGALNASYRFYAGLVDGGGLRMSESDILSDVWSREEETRDDTREWLYAFLLLAYEPLDEEELEAYIALSETAQGKALNRALFSGFNAMYDELSYAIGLAAAQQLRQQDL